MFRLLQVKMNENQNNQSIREHAGHLIRGYQVPSHKNRQEALDAILKKIHSRESGNLKVRRISTGTRAVVGVAAAVVLLVVLYILTAKVTYSGADGTTRTCRLSDDSRVVLEGNSTLITGRFIGTRNTRLRGTAYFEVEKGDRFRVKTKTGTVEVLGTRFSVSEKTGTFLVQCFEGKVKAFNQQSSAILTKGKVFEGTLSGGVQSDLEDTREYPDFARFSRQYSNQSLKQILTEMEQFFGVKINPGSAGERKFSGSIETGNLQEAITIVCMSMQLEYQVIENNKIIIKEK